MANVTRGANLGRRLRAIGACGEAVEWARAHATLASAWRQCERGDWMMWLAATLGVRRQSVVLAACECARLVATRAKDPRVLACIETTERWAKGKATPEEVRQARHAAADAYAAAAAAADAYAAAAAAAADAAAAAYAAAYAAAAYAAAAAAAAADAAADAYAAADVAYAAAADAREKVLLMCAVIVRRRLTRSVMARWGVR